MASGKVDVNTALDLKGLNDKVTQGIRNATLHGINLISMANPELANSITDKMLNNQKIEELRKALFPKKTVITVEGTASMEGDLSENLKIAENRAKAGEKAIKSKMKPGDFDKYFTVVRKTKVVGPEGQNAQGITNAAELRTAQSKMIDKFNKQAKNAKVKKEIKTWKDMLAILKNPQNKFEKEFVENNFNYNRRVSLTFLPPKTGAQEFSITPVDKSTSRTVS